MELLKPGIGLIIWQTFVFLLLVILLAKLAWKPILSSLREREKSIQDALDTAEKARQEISKLKGDNENLLKQAREERDRMLREAREATNRMREDAEITAKKSAVSKSKLHFATSKHKSLHSHLISQRSY